MIAVGALLHAKQLSRSPFEIATALIVPVVQATLAVYLFRAGGEPGRLLEAAVGAGLMGVWSSVLFGSGGAIQGQRWQGTLEMIMLAPRPPALVILPITLATALTGTYAMLATLLWGRVLYGIPLDFAHPLLFLVAVPGCVLGLGMFGLLLASTFVLMRNANALTNTLEYPNLAGLRDAGAAHRAARLDRTDRRRAAHHLGRPGGPRGGHRRAGLALARHLPGDQPRLPGRGRADDDPRRATGPRRGDPRAGLRRRR